MNVWLVTDEKEPQFCSVWFSKAQALDYAKHTAQVCTQTAGHVKRFRVVTEETPNGLAVMLQIRLNKTQLSINKGRGFPTQEWRTVRDWYINEKKVRGDLVTALGELSK